MPTYLQDKKLVKSLLNGDERAFARFFDDYHARLFRFALARLNNDQDAAAEVAQITLSRAIQKLHTYRAEAQLFTWLCSICRNVSSDWCARQGRIREHIVLVEDYPEIRAAVESIAAPEQDDPERNFQRTQAARLIQVALDRLPARYGNVLEWKYVEGYSTREISERLEIGSEAAQSLLARAKRAFADVYSTLLLGLEQDNKRAMES